MSARPLAVLAIAALSVAGLTACSQPVTVNCLDRQAYIVPMDVAQKGVAPRPPAPKSGTSSAGRSQTRPGTSSGSRSSTVRTPTSRFSSTAPRTYSSASARRNTYYSVHFYDNVHYGVSVNPYLPLRPYYIGWGYPGYHPFSTYTYLYGWGDGYAAGAASQC